MKHKKTFAIFVTILLCSGMTESFATDRIDPATPEGAIAIERKIHCSLVDNKPVLYSWEGEVFSRRMGEPDKKLFRVSGMNIRQCVTIDGGRRGKGYRLVSREIMLYLDPVSGKLLNRWRNPFTGHDVTVFPVQNDPVNGRPAFPYGKNGKPQAKWHGRSDSGSWFLSFTIPLFYQNILQGQYQKYVGGAYHATEMFNFMGEINDLTDSGKDTAQVKIGWVRLSAWLPWMEMQGREGMLYTHASGQKISGFAALPAVLKEYINRKAPLYKTPPPGDDSRANVTSWSYFKKHVKGGNLPFGGEKEDRK